MHRYRAVSLTLLFELVDSAASYKRSRSLLRIFLSKLRKHDLEDNRISLSTVGSKQSFLTEAFNRVEHRYESGTASESAKRAHVFAGLYSSVHSSVSFGGSGLRLTDDCPETFWGFRRRARSLQSTPPLWQLHQSRMKSTCLLCSLQRMYDGWTKLISNVQPPMKAAPQLCSEKAHFKFSRVWRYSSVRRLSSEERMAKLSRLSPSSLTYVWAAAKIENDSWRSATIGKVVSLFAAERVRVATCNMTVDTYGRNWIWISRDPAKASRPRDLKIDSGEKSFPLEVANQLARYF